MLARKQRLPIAEFPKKGFLILRTGYFNVKITGNNQTGNRFAVIIGKSQAKKSTRRHYLKRLILAKLAERPKGNKDVLVIAQRSLEMATKATIIKDLEQVISPNP